jgi:uncharacterized protein (TIGR03790 family)
VAYLKALKIKAAACLVAGVWAAPAGLSQTHENVLLVINQASTLSREIGDYYVRRRSIPLANVCRLNVTDAEEVSWDVYEKQIEQPIGEFLRKGKLEEKTLYFVTTLGVPLRVNGGGAGLGTETCAVDSELALLYAKLHGKKFPRAGMVPNPLFRKRDQAFRHPDFPMYLVTRLAGYDFADVKAEIDRALEARNRGKFVIDLAGNSNKDGNNWLRAAALLLPADRVVLDETDKVLTGVNDVIGYAAWGSNDPNRHQRHLGFQWLPGAIVTEYVSTNARTFRRPPDGWNISTWSETDKPRWFAGAPQTLTADYIHEGATGCSGHVAEPYLAGTPRPEYLLPAYFSGRNLAESYYLAIPALSWMNIVVGDPLCRIGKP